jgi:hypothetical protein
MITCIILHKMIVDNEPGYATNTDFNNIGEWAGDVFWLAVFILLEKSSPSRRMFIVSHSLPPLWSPVRSFKWYQSRLRVFWDYNQSNI